MQNEETRFKDLLSLKKGENLKEKGNFEISRDSLRQPCRAYCFSLLFCSSGAAVIENDKRTFGIKEGFDFCILPHTVNTILSMTPNAKFSFVAISETSILEKCSRLGPYYFRFLYKNPLAPQIPKALYYRKTFYEQMDYYCQQTQGKYLNEKRMNLIQNYFYDIYDCAKEVWYDKEDDVSSPKFLPTKFINMLADNCIDHHDVEYYAKELGVSSRYLTLTLSKSYGGHTPKELIDDHLIFEAKTLLRDPRLSIQEVAEKLNFSDQSVFSRLFRRKTNLSPTEWRNSEC